MRKFFKFGLLIISLSLCFSNCNKFRDKWYHQYHEYNQPQKEFDLCRLMEIHQYAAPSFEKRIGKFYYSPNGNLDSLSFSDGVIYYWTYNGNNQLIEFRESLDHDKNDYQTLHTYAIANGKVIRDTSRSPGLNTFITEIWSLQYDKVGRVIRETGYRTDDEAPGPLPDRNYNYDANGNLASSNYERDNEVNYLRTSKVLQFVLRDYSMNNFKKNLLGYNKYHLPVAFFGAANGFLRGEAPLKLVYSCVSTPPVPGSNNQCQINTVKQSWEQGPGFTSAIFYYTPDGRPLSVYYQDDINGREHELHSFLYNRHDQLVGYEIIDSYPIVLHGYGYTSGKITSDTMYSERPYEDQFRQVSTLTYDRQRRIIKEDMHVVERNFTPASEHSTKIYNYDNNGNMVNPLVTVYDSKVNYLRTDPVWMFIHRNYNRNNPQGVTQYNSKNLPLGFKKEVFDFFAFGDPLEIEYMCDGAMSVGSK